MIQSAVRGPRPVRNFQIALIVGTTIILAACSSDSTNEDSNPQVQTTVTNSPADTPSSDGAGIPGNSRSSVLGEVLVFGNDNLTLYTFANDTDGQSSCSGGCAADWPPLYTDQREPNKLSPARGIFIPRQPQVPEALTDS